MERPTAAEGIAVVLGVLTSLWWARPFLGMTSSGILSTLQHIGYDNVSHFGMYRSNVELGSFVQARPNLPDGAARFGYDYPQGIHQAWAQLTRLVQPNPSSSTSWLLHAYLDVLLVTAGAAVTLGCMAVCRLCRRDVLVAIPAMAVIVALFAVGTFTPFDGFANYELAVVSVAAAVTLMVRPTLPPTWNFIAVAGLGLAAAYNWYPLLVMVAPALVVATLRAWSASRGRGRWVMTAVICATAVAYLLPFTAFSHRGLSWLNQPTSSLATPWGLLIVVVAGLITLACVRQLSHPELMTNVIIGGTAALGTAAVAFVAAYEVHSTGSVPYYGQKLAYAVLAVCAVVLVAVGACHVAASKVRKRLPTLVAVILAGLLAVAALQFDGYAGPGVVSPFSSNNAGGITLRDLVFQQPKSSSDAGQLLGAAAMARGRPGTWLYLEPNPPSGIYWYLITSWFWILKGDASNEQFLQPIPLQLSGAFTPGEFAEQIIKTYRPSDADLHLFVPSWLRRAIVQRAHAWDAPGRLLEIPGSSVDPPPG